MCIRDSYWIIRCQASRRTPGTVSAQGGCREIHQLKYVICVAKLESISKAATTLHLSQPALSKSIAKLEDELGVLLFDRSGKRLHLNDRGRLFLEGAEKALRELDSAAASVSAEAGSLQGSLSIGVFGMQNDAISCIQRFMQENRRVHVMLDARQRSITARVVREFDMVFYPEGPAFGGICLLYTSCARRFGGACRFQRGSAGFLG